MPYRYVEPDVYLEHNGITVFHVYRDGTDEPWTYWFTTDKDTADSSYGHGDGGHFDARRLDGRFDDTPNMQEWEDFWKPRFKREDECIRAMIQSAIESGRLPKPSAQ